MNGIEMLGIEHARHGGSTIVYEYVEEAPAGEALIQLLVQALEERLPVSFLPWVRQSVLIDEMSIERDPPISLQYGTGTTTYLPISNKVRLKIAFHAPET